MRTGSKRRSRTAWPVCVIYERYVAFAVRHHYRRDVHYCHLLMSPNRTCIFMQWTLYHFSYQRRSNDQ
jgi:hypothetical protein